MMYPTSDVRSVLSLVLAAACWGIGAVITKSLLPSIPPITLLLIQLAFSFAFLYLLVLLKRLRFPGRSIALKMGLLGILNPGISYTLSLIGLRTTPASTSTLLWATEPILIIGLAWVLLRERPTPRLFLLSAVAIAGVIVVSGTAPTGVTEGSAFGNLLILGGVVCCALYTILASRFGSEWDPLIAIAIQQAFAFVWALALLPFELTGTSVANLQGHALETWLLAGVSGIVYYALAFWFYLRGLKYSSASLAGTSINLIPIFGIGAAYLFLGERLSIAQWVGAFGILFAVFAIWLQPNKEMVLTTLTVIPSKEEGTSDATRFG